MLDTIPAEPTAGLVVVALAAALVAVRLLRRHATAVVTLALVAVVAAVGVAYALGARGTNLVVDALAAALSVLIEASLSLARVVDLVLAAGFELLVAVADRVFSSGGPALPDPSVGLPEGALPTVGFLGFAAAVLVLFLLAGLVLVWFGYGSTTSPLGAWAGAVGVVLGMAGALWTLLQANAFGLTTVQLLAAVVAAPVGLALGVLSALFLLKPNSRVAAEHADELERGFATEDVNEDDRATRTADDGS